MATPIFIDGWEPGHINSWVWGIFGAPTVQSSVVRTGSYAARFYKTTDDTCYLSRSISGANYTIVGRLYVRFDAWPSVNEVITSITPTAGDALALRLNASTHRVEALFGASTVGNACSTELSLNTWYRLDYRFSCAANPSTIDFQVDGTAASQSTYAQAASYLSTQRIGATVAGQYDFFIDDYVLSATAGDYPLGPGGIIGLSPSAAGTSNPGDYIQDNGNAVVNDSTNPANAELDDVPMTSSADYIKQTAIGADLYAEVVFADTEEETIWGVSSHVAYHASGSTPANSATAKIVDSNGQESNIKSGDMSETVVSRAAAMVAVPSGGWSMAHVNALRGRVGFATNVDTVPYWDALMIQVAYGTVQGSSLVRIVNE